MQVCPCILELVSKRVQTSGKLCDSLRCRHVKGSVGTGVVRETIEIKCYMFQELSEDLK
jgi:hypothetical protein